MNAPFADLQWSERFKTLGNLAEMAFEDWARKNEVQFERMGFRGSSLPRNAMLQLPTHVRHTPDYLAYKMGQLKWVECVGTSDLSRFKIRLSKHEGQSWWNRDLEVTYFLWHSPSQSYAWTTWQDISDEIVGGAPLEHFTSDGNAYFVIEIDPTSWVKL